MKNRKWLKVLLVLLAVVIMGVIFSCQANPRNENDSQDESILHDSVTTALLEEEDNPEESAEAETASETTSEPGKVCIHVCGSVKKPGVYYLNNGARVHEAIEAAGGLSKGADDTFINLAQVLSDGEKIYVPSASETEDQTHALTEEDTTQKDSKIDINTASEKELMTLSGIGESKAQAIVAYRTDNGNFSEIKDIMKVSGIGEAVYEKIKDNIKV